MKPAGELAQLFERQLEVVAGGDEDRLRRRGILVQGFLRPAEVDGEGDEALLRAVVEVAFEPAALGDARFDDARARGGELGVRLGALERERDEAREVGEALLRVGSEVAAARGEHGQRAPEPAACRDRRHDGGSVAGQPRQPRSFAR